MSNPPDEKRCPGCGETKPLCEFYKNSGKRQGVQARCKACTISAAQAWRAANPDQSAARSRNSRMKRLFGIGATEYEALLATQCGTCAVCKMPCDSGNRLAVDHDHATGAVRGLLCVRCNTALGLMRDDPSLLHALIEYLTAPPLALPTLSVKTCAWPEGCDRATPTKRHSYCEQADGDGLPQHNHREAWRVRNGADRQTASGLQVAVRRQPGTAPAGQTGSLPPQGESAA